MTSSEPTANPTASADTWQATVRGDASTVANRGSTAPEYLGKCSTVANRGSDGAIPEEKLSSEWAQRIKVVRFLLQGLGAAVCISFVAQGVGILINHGDVPDFWQGCHWISEIVLCWAVGLGMLALEARVFIPRIRQHLRTFFVNRLGLALMYAWIGCFSMGGRIQEGGDTWSTIGKITGILGWLVAVGDVAISCCSDRSERMAEDDVATRQNSDSERGRGASTYSTYSTGTTGSVPMYDPGRDSSMTAGTRPSAQSQTSSAAAPTGVGTPAVAPPPAAIGASAPPAAPETGADTSNPFAEDPVATDTQNGIASGQQWNTAASKPFGSA